IDPGMLREGVLAGEGLLSALVPEHLELFRAQALSPLLLGARELLPGPLPSLDLLVHHASLDADLTFGSEERYSSDPPRSPRNARNSAYVPCEASSGVRSSNAAIPQTSRTRGQPASEVHLVGRPSLRARVAGARPCGRT